jgi:deoxyribonuclease-4
VQSLGQGRAASAAPLWDSAGGGGRSVSMALMALDVRRVGFHLPLARGMLRALQRAVDLGANTLQVFTDNPSTWRRRAAPPEELPAFRAALAENDIVPLAAHAPYLLNLATADQTIWERSIATLIHELRMGAAYGAAFVVIHLGSHRGSGLEAGIRRLGLAVARAFAAVPPQPGTPLLVLENSAGGGDGIGGTAEELAAVLDAVIACGADPSRVSFCLDTAHAWGAGYELSRPEITDSFLERVDALLGPGRIALVHFNDSRAELGSHVDRHEHIGAGRIGGEGMGYILRHERLSAVPFILETPGMDEGFDAVNMDRVRLLLRGMSLPPLRRPAAPSRPVSEPPRPGAGRLGP